MISSGRLYLRRWREEDAEALFRYASDERVSRLALWPRHTSVEMSREVIRNYFMPYPLIFAIVLKDSDEPVGCIGLVPPGDEHYPVAPDEREVGYWIGFPYWNQGLTTEALMALTGYCREAMDINSLIITADARNRASQRVAEKCGFEFAGDYAGDESCGKVYRLKTERGEVSRLR